ncbi:hypothetical protein M501DRAFT_927022 [Patellaria atrata CBS 101060]|uniref:Histone acetyltransferase n=1 Tax=Patellaria atrata CBS 101060 TaxID=1346257 RepID=A0A9P4SGC7_9PEZI|nr:hypothetical protein M501DRAFT_927022 [Patellaria atrata CBS 101060]
MASEPSRPISHNINEHAEDSDIDAEHEEDGFDLDELLPEIKQDINGAESIGSDVDAEGEEVEDEDEEDEDEEHNAEAVGAVKIANADTSSEDGDEDAMVDSSSDAKDSDSGGDSDGSETGSDAENEWEGESDAGGEAEVEISDPNRCIFCGQDEEHDPSEDFEEYLSCAVCGDNAHRQCARNAKSLSTEEDPERWRCVDCVKNGLEEDTRRSDGSMSNRRSSAPKIARDLLPANRGVIKPDSHSVFNKLILDDDPMDGSRSLRKRKASSDEAEPRPVVRSSRKRRRPSEESSSASEDENRTSGRGSVINIAPSEKHFTDGARDSLSDQDASSRVRSSRPRRNKKIEYPPARVVDVEGGVLVMAFRVDKTRLAQILASRPKKKSFRVRDRSRKIQVAQMEPEVSHYPAIQSTNFIPFYAFHDREHDESKSKPYGGILSEADADTSKTFPQAIDRKRFEDARLKAEEDWKQKTTLANGVLETTKANKHSGNPSKIKSIIFGEKMIDTWHAAPYPEEYSRNKLLYICEFCLKYMNSDYVAWRHKLKCPARHPPGDEIYRDTEISFFEVDGRKNPVYCQNLCLLAKLFLGSKTLYYDVEPFLFYVMTERDEYGCHFLGYFSKEKRPSSLNNVSCILVLPISQRKGYGHMLIEFSYLLTRVEKKTGSPEKPLSDMGLVSYRSYWRLILCKQLVGQKDPISISRISEQTGMTPDDIVSGLEGLRALVRDPVTKTYALRLDLPYYRQYIADYEKKKIRKINPDALVWVPYVMGRNNLSHYEEGMALQTIAPREGEGEDCGAPKAVAEEGVQLENATTNGDQSGSQNADSTPSPTDEMLGIKNTDLLVKSTSHPKSTIPIHPAHHSGPSTPNGNSYSALPSQISIPAFRFEVFPPIPGNSAKKRPSTRPFGTRRKTSTPLRRSTSNLGLGVMNDSPIPIPTANASVRRTRSKLGEVVHGIDFPKENGEIKDEEKSPTKTNGKGKIIGESAEKEVADEDANGDANADGDADTDADGEADADAEGEPDDDIDAEGEDVEADMLMVNA